jgi:hypothetical protein
MAADLDAWRAVIELVLVIALDLLLEKPTGSDPPWTV